MKTSSLLKLKSLVLLLSFVFTLSSCDLFKEPTLEEKLEGTWKVTSAVGPMNGQTVDIWALLSAFYPCVKEGTVSFSGGVFTSYIPAKCVDNTGESLNLFPTTGSFTVSEAGLLTITGDGLTYAGQITFSDDKTVTFVVTEDGETFTFTFTKQ